jgi:PLD-like domain
MSPLAPFTLRIHRGEGMALLAMDWREGRPPADFAGFAISYREPGGDRDFVLQNRLGFDLAHARWLPTTLAPIQKFRWVHFPRNADLPGMFAYTVTPVFMNASDELSYGPAATEELELNSETYPGRLNVAFTRGFVSSQAFVDRFAPDGKIDTLLPPKADAGLTFVPTHPHHEEALAWMGFEARRAILDVLRRAADDAAATVRVIAYDLNDPEVVDPLVRMGDRVRVIVDDSKDHKGPDTAETAAAAALGKTAQVRRQHMGGLQHNKTIVVDSPTQQIVVCGSTNFSWRGLYVQNNNALIVQGERAVELAAAAFDAYWEHGHDAPGFAATPSAQTVSLGLDGIDATIAYSPHRADTARLEGIADDIRKTESSLLYSMAFLAQTPGSVRDAIAAVTARDDRFVYGIADDPVHVLDLQRPGGNPAPVFPSQLDAEDLPPPFRPEPTGGLGIRLHHKFVVIDFDKPTARVYTGSYNFSNAADTANGENLLLIRDARVASSYAVEALRIFDHYHFRVSRREADEGHRELVLTKPPRAADEHPWWEEYWTDPVKIRDRQLFAR